MQRRGRTFWTSLIRKLEHSPLPAQQFADQQVCVATLRKWLYRLRREQAPAFVQVQLAEPTPPAQPSPSKPGLLEAVLPDGLRLRFAPGTDGVYLAKLLTQLRQASC